MAKGRTSRRSKTAASASGSRRNPDDLDLDALCAQAAREMRKNKGRIEAGESFASGRRGGPEGSASENKNRWYG
jgi:hypothetical protein